MTLTESRIEIASRATTLFYLSSDAPPAKPLPFSDEARYNMFHQTVAVIGNAPYSTVVPTGKPAVLDKFSIPYHDNKYWRRVLQGAPNPRQAWRNLLPISSSFQSRITILPPVGFTAKISPLPMVLLYPFGWSVWFRLRVLGNHTLEQLSSLASYLFSDKCWSVDGGTGIGFQALLDLLGDGVKSGAFGGPDTEVAESADRVIVTTVLARMHGSPAIFGLGADEEQQLKRLIRPEGAASKRKLADMAVKLHDKVDVDYMIIDDFGRFIWMEHLLQQGSPEDGRNYRWLNCYHANSLVSFVQAWNMAALVSAAANVAKPPASLAALVYNAKDRLQKPRFTNASVRAYLQSSEVQSLFPKKDADKP